MRRSNGSHSHEHDPVLHGEALREGGEPRGEPGVDRHVRHDPRSVYEACLGGHEKESPFGKDRDEGEHITQRPVAEHGVGKDGVEGLALAGWTPQRR